jgi:hypothetical protein
VRESKKQLEIKSSPVENLLVRGDATPKVILMNFNSLGDFNNFIDLSVLALIDSGVVVPLGVENGHIQNLNSIIDNTV